jgi:acyl carrier protein
MNQLELEAKVLSVLNSVLHLDLQSGCRPSRQDLPNWDSLKHIEIIFGLEEELGLEFTEDELAGMDSLEKIMAAAQGKYAA